MVQPQIAASRSLWKNPDVLADLLDYLRARGFRITVDEYAAVQDLVLAVIARGGDISDDTSLKTYLAPVLCTTPREQVTFSAHFDRWSTRLVKTESLGSQRTLLAERELEVASQRWRLWRWVLAAVGVAIGTGVMVFWGIRRLPHSKNSNPALDSRFLVTILIYILIVVSLILLTWAAWWYFRGRLFLKRRATTEEPDLVRVEIDSQECQYLNWRLLKHAARELRRRFAVQSSELAIAPTVEQTIRNNGQFMPVFASRLIAPEYLVLIDRKNFRDHHAQYVDEMIDVLESDQVRLERYYFDNDPRIVFAGSSGHNPPLTFQDLAARYSGFRVLIFTDATGFFNSVSGELEYWADSLLRWAHCALFTPNPPETWGYRESFLAKRGVIMTATTESILQFARNVNGNRAALATNSMCQIGPFPSELVRRPNRWLELDCPEPKLLEDVLVSIRRFLGEEGYFWFSACAVYPAIEFNLTLYLGSNLKDAVSAPLFTSERLSSLFRLPWLRSGYMPNWLPLELVRSLSHKQNTQIREVLNRLWLSRTTGSTKAIRLEIARSHPRALTALASVVFHRLAHRSSLDSPLRDHVFASVMLCRCVDPLTVRVPRIWRKFIKSRKATMPLNPSNDAVKTPGGIGRLACLGIVVGIQILATFLQAIARGAWPIILVFLLSNAASCITVSLRLRNMGRNRWLSLLVPVPIVNLFIWIPCLYAPPNYAHTKKLDLLGKIVFWVLISLGIVVLVLIIIAFLFSHTA